MSGNKVTKQLNVVSQPSINSNIQMEDVALYQSGSPMSFGGVTAYTTATATGTAAKSISATKPTSAGLLALTFTNGNSVASPTLTFSDGGPFNLFLGGTAPAVGEIVVGSGGAILIYFDGSLYHQIGVYS